MRYRTRHAEKRLSTLARHFKVVLVTGARQTGKSTLLAHVFPNVKAVVFDPVQDIFGVRADPDLFLDNFPAPMILDEVQFAPEVLPSLKRRVDSSDAMGQYFLSGSQNLGVLRNVAESLAGRVGILPLEGMTLDEIEGHGDRAGWLGAYLDNPESLLDIYADRDAPIGAPARVLWRGGLPALLDAPDGIVAEYLRSYVQTYVERDIRLAEDIREVARFGRFLGLAAALTAQEINASQLGRDVGVNPTTARKWLDLLTATFQWLELFPYHGNTLKRLSGKRKGFFRDTGLACSLQRVSSPDALAVSPLLGPVFETWVVNDIHKQFVHMDVPPQAWHWRTAGGAEVDLVLERDGKLYPVEIKCKTHLSKEDARGIRAFRETYKDRVATGLVVYAGEGVYRLAPHAIALPWTATRGSAKG